MLRTSCYGDGSFASSNTRDRFAAYLSDLLIVY